jgi:hypothetical protein
MPDQNIRVGPLPSPPQIGADTPTAVTAFVDFFASGPLAKPTPVSSFAAFQQNFGPLDPRSEAGYQLQQFFLTGGKSATVLRIQPEPSDPQFAAALKTALTTLSHFNLLVIPATANLGPADMHTVMLAAQNLCSAHKAFYVADIPPSSVISTPAAIEAWFANSGLSALDCAAIYYPRITISDSLHAGQQREIGSSGSAAGVYAHTDASQAVWKSPAGAAAIIPNATPAVALTDAQNTALSTTGINSIRAFPGQGTVLWGARTTAGADSASSEFKYVSVRRLAIFLEASLTAGLSWVTFEPNTPALWSTIRLTVNAFMLHLFQQGAFQGTQPKEAFFIKCDATTTTQADIDNGRVNIQIGFAPLRPAEFIIFNISQWTRPPH